MRAITKLGYHAYYWVVMGLIGVSAVAAATATVGRIEGKLPPKPSEICCQAQSGS